MPISQTQFDHFDYHMEKSWAMGIRKIVLKSTSVKLKITTGKGFD